MAKSSFLFKYNFIKGEEAKPIQELKLTGIKITGARLPFLKPAEGLSLLLQWEDPCCMGTAESPAAQKHQAVNYSHFLIGRRSPPSAYFNLFY